MTHREIDALVATEVMGLQGPVKEIPPLGPHWRPDDCPWVPVPHYTEDIAAAWEVVEKMEADGWGLTLYTRGAYTDEGLGPSDRRGCWFAREIDGYEHDTGLPPWGNDTQHLPTLICLAALSTLGITLPEDA